MYLELRAVPFQRPGDWRLLLEEEPAAGVARSPGRSSSISGRGGGTGKGDWPRAKLGMHVDRQRSTASRQHVGVWAGGRWLR